MLSSKFGAKIQLFLDIRKKNRNFFANSFAYVTLQSQRIYEILPLKRGF